MLTSIFLFPSTFFDDSKVNFGQSGPDYFDWNPCFSNKGNRCLWSYLVEVFELFVDSYLCAIDAEVSKEKIVIRNERKLIQLFLQAQLYVVIMWSKRNSVNHLLWQVSHIWVFLPFSKTSLFEFIFHSLQWVTGVFQIVLCKFNLDFQLDYPGL